MQTTPLKKIALALTTLATLTVVSDALADGPTEFDPKERARITLLLRGYDVTADAKAFSAVAADPQAHLLAIAADPASTALIRLQALGGLAQFPNTKTLDVYTGIIAKAGLDTPGDRALHRVIQHMAFGFGAQALPHIEPLLRHTDEQVRLTVVHAMASLGEEAKAKLRAHSVQEKNARVLEAIEAKATSLR